ncbi:MAG: hypothetical protein ACI8RA_003045 [Chlamydiales bacterium]|jgi:hypothetical protein
MKPLPPLSPIHEIPAVLECDETTDASVIQGFNKFSPQLYITMSHLPPLDCHNFTTAIPGVKDEDGRACRQYYSDLLERIGVKVERGENLKVRAYEISQKIESQLRALVYDFGRGYTADGCDMQERIHPCIWIDKTGDQSYREIIFLKRCLHTSHYYDDLSFSDIYARCKAKPTVYPDLIKFIQKASQERSKRHNSFSW